MSLDNSDTFGISSSFVTASNLPDNKGLELELKSIWATCFSTIEAFSSITKISSNCPANFSISSIDKGLRVFHTSTPVVDTLPVTIGIALRFWFILNLSSDLSASEI